MKKATKEWICFVLTAVLLLSSAIIAYAASDDEVDNRYTVVLQSTNDEDEVYSVQAEPAEDMYDTFSAYFDDITAGTYNVLVYYLNAEAGNNSLCTSTQWTCEAAEGETDSIRVDYFTVINDVDVTVTAIHNPNEDKTDGRYTIVLQDAEDEEIVYTETATSDDSNEVVAAVFDDITAGTYNVTVYYLNVEGGNTSTCARTQWTSEAAEGETDNVRVEYNILTEDINILVVAIHNPDVDETETTDSRYTIVLQNTANEDEIYSETAEPAEDMYDTFSAYFDGITAGTYNVIVYYLNAEAGNTSTCLRTQWTSEAAEGETDSIRVDYFTVINEVEVTVTAIHNPDQDKTDGRYTIVLQDTADESKVFTETATSDDSNEIVSAVFDNITAGTYNVTVYYLNVEGGNTSTCARTQWTSEAAKGETDNVRVEYNLLTEEINVSVVAIHNPSDSEEATTPDTTKPADSNQAESTTVAASTSTDNSTSPKTGDTTALEIYVLMTVVSGLVIAFFIYRKKANSVG